MSELYQKIKLSYQLSGFASHVTHVDNAEKIIQRGELISLKEIQNKGGAFKDIANSSVQFNRSLKKNIYQGHDLHDYVPLYFGTKTPMMAALQDINDELVILRFSLNLLGKYECLLADGNAASAKTKFRPYTSIEDLEILNVEAINSQKFKDDPEKRRCKQAELLVLKRLPLSELHHVICRTDMVKEKLENLLKAHKGKVDVLKGYRNHYYL